MLDYGYSELAVIIKAENVWNGCGHILNGNSDGSQTWLKIDCLESAAGWIRVLFAVSMVTVTRNGMIPVTWLENAMPWKYDLPITQSCHFDSFMGRQRDHGKMIRFLLKVEHMWCFGWNMWVPYGGFPWFPARKGVREPRRPGWFHRRPTRPDGLSFPKWYMIHHV